LSMEHELGLNVLQRMLVKGFELQACDELECMAYNISLDLVLRLFEKYSALKKVSIWSNTEKVTFTAKNRTRILELIDAKRIVFFHLPENINAIHGKIYIFKKDGAIRFVAIGSPNLSDHANQNFESLVYIFDKAKCEAVWQEIPRLYTELNLKPEETTPVQLYQTQALETKIDPKFFEGLWKHQIEALSWLASKQFAIVNIPPGTGKTEIAFTYLRYLLEHDENLTTIVLVPTTTLVTQWKNRLDSVGISNAEWGTVLSSLGGYFADPVDKVLVTLYQRFFDQYAEYEKRAKILKPNLLLILDECHSSYEHVDDLAAFRNMVQAFGRKMYAIGLSATIDSFKVWAVNDFVNFMGGEANQFEISLQSFYSHWNNLNQTPVLKLIRYMPIKYCLNEAEMEKLKEYGKRVAIEMGKRTLSESDEPTAAIQRARWLRGLPGGISVLQDYIMSHMDGFTGKATIIFVQTNEIAENLQAFITRQSGWDPNASVYVYDSSREENYRTYALAQFRKNLGFCLVSEKMLSEGFDLPKVDRVILHGSDKSPRDWIQKIGRALRFDKENPDSIAEIVDVVFCETNGEPLPMEKERYECLMSISQ